MQLSLVRTHSDMNSHNKLDGKTQRELRIEHVIHVHTEVKCVQVVTCKISKNNNNNNNNTIGMICVYQAINNKLAQLLKTSNSSTGLSNSFLHLTTEQNLFSTSPFQQKITSVHTYIHTCTCTPTPTPCANQQRHVSHLAPRWAHCSWDHLLSYHHNTLESCSQSF